MSYLPLSGQFLTPKSITALQHYIYTSDAFTDSYHSRTTNLTFTQSHYTCQSYMAPPQSLTEVVIEPVTFPPTVKPPASDKSFFLGGAGERGLEIEGKFIKFTAIGVYLEDIAVKELSVKWKSKSASELADSDEFFRDIVAGPFEKFARVTMILPLTGQQYSEKVSENCVSYWKATGIYSDAEAKAIEKFLAVFKEETFPPGSSVLFKLSPNGSLGISFLKDGSVPEAENAVIENKPLSLAILDSMIGKHGVSPPAKKSLAARLSAFMNEEDKSHYTYMAPPQSLTEVVIESVSFPPTVKPPASDKIFFLGGAGERGLEIEGKFIKFTAIGVYLEDIAVKELSLKWMSKSASELADSYEFFRDIVTGPFEKFAQVTMILPLTGQQYSEKVSENCVAYWKAAGIYSDAEAKAVEKFLAIFKEETFPPGSSILFKLSPNGSLGISFSKDGSVPEAENAVIENKPLSLAILESMIGKHGVSPPARKSLATRLSEFMKSN